jgi:hypothetical protein
MLINEFRPVERDHPHTKLRDGLGIHIPDVHQRSKASQPDGNLIADALSPAGHNNRFISKIDPAGAQVLGADLNFPKLIVVCSAYCLTKSKQASECKSKNLATSYLYLLLGGQNNQANPKEPIKPSNAKSIITPLPSVVLLQVLKLPVYGQSQTLSAAPFMHATTSPTICASMTNYIIIIFRIQGKFQVK